MIAETNLHAKKLERECLRKPFVYHIVRLELRAGAGLRESVNNPQTAIQLLEVLAKFEERYSCKATLGVAMRTTLKEINGSRDGISFKAMIADLTIGDINLEIEVKMILVEGTKEIGLRVKILVEAVENRWDGLNVLKVNDIKDETFTKALWDTRAEKSFISEETYQKYFFYKQVKKSGTRVITAQGAKCRNMGVVELNIRIRDFEKPWLFHVLADL
ncbi:uncharacterized protein TNCV_26321 [Trichonephila clavipes]|nr:uncharacterized protein TNCV_26321 [Trichonephila clavipes]